MRTAARVNASVHPRPGRHESLAPGHDMAGLGQAGFGSRHDFYVAKGGAVVHAGQENG